MACGGSLRRNIEGKPSYYKCMLESPFTPLFLKAMVGDLESLVVRNKYGAYIIPIQ